MTIERDSTLLPQHEARCVIPAWQATSAQLRDERLLFRAIWLIALLWTLALAASLYWNVRLQYDNAYTQARHKAVDHFSKELAFRLWGVGKGGLYLDVDSGSPPIDYLDFLPDRDIKLADGRTLTLYDPVSALKQVINQHGKLYGVAGRIVSEHPFNPAALPDAWEAQALQAFRSGSKEVFEITNIDGAPHVRVIRPMPTKPSCLKCHVDQGYAVGNIMGAISLSVPLAEFTEVAASASKSIALSHSAIWLLGLTGLFFGRRRIHQHLCLRWQQMAEAELSAKVFNDGLQAACITDSHGKILRINPMFTEITGYTEREAIGRYKRLLESGEHDPSELEEYEKHLIETGCWVGDLWFRRKDGRKFLATETSSIVYDEAGHPRYGILMFRDITEQRQNQERIYQLAHYDQLTGLANRELFTDRGRHAIELAQRHNTALAVLYIDLDQFKAINDTLGHKAGDRMLKIASERLQSSSRSSDTVARLGGDEFAILIEDNSGEGFVAADTVAEKILARFAEPTVLDDRPWHVGASIGISVFPRDGKTLETLLQHADMAMYRAKQEGRNRMCFFDESIGAKVTQRLDMEAALRDAIATEAFSIHYQPQYDVDSNRVIALEALLRWQDGDHAILPEEFIPIAEETGLITSLGKWMLQTACADIVRLHRQGYPGVRLAVNISAVEFRRRDFVAQVVKTLDETGLTPDLLELEITESVMMSKVEQVTDNFQQLSELGVHLAIDDFGSGYSSLAYLKHLPVRCLKIDKSFVKDAPASLEDIAIVRTIISMSHSLGLNVIAEGVETEGQLALLKREGCHLVQGFLQSRPLPFDALPGVLEKHG